MPPENRCFAAGHGSTLVAVTGTLRKWPTIPAALANWPVTAVERYSAGVFPMSEWAGTQSTTSAKTHGEQAAKRCWRRDQRLSCGARRNGHSRSAPHPHHGGQIIAVVPAKMLAVVQTLI